MRENTVTTFRRFNGRLVNGTIYSGDALAFLDRLPANSADIVFLDPPFNLKKKYGRGAPKDSLEEEEYKLWLSEVILKSIRTVAEGGALYLYHLPKWAVQAASLLAEHLEFRHWVSITMKNGFVRGDRLYPAHYALLYFTKGSPAYFRRPKLSLQKCRHCNNLIKDYGGYRKIIENQGGVNLSDVWDDITPLRHKSTKSRSANELPPKILERVCAISGTPNGMFIDPFCGSGVSLVQASKYGMKFRACDIVENNCSTTVNRILEFKNNFQEVSHRWN